MKPKHLFLTLLALLASAPISFASTYIGGLYYNLNADNLTAEVTYQNTNSTIKTAVIPASVTYSGKTYSVTSIGSGAFASCSSLKSVTIPNSVISIGDFAFTRCTSLTSVTIPNSVTSIVGSAFSGCTGLTSPVYNTHVFAYMPASYSGAYTIPDGIESIAGGAFYECSGLTSVTIPNSVTSIGDYAFEYCSGLTSVTIPNSVTSIVGSAFSGCTGLTSPVYNTHVFAYMPTSYSGAYTIPDGIESIAGGAFYECSGLTSVTIPNSVTSIGDYAFDDCTGLTSVVWNAKNCSTSCGFGSQVESFVFGSEVEKIPAFCCNGMSNLTSVIIPNRVTSIGNYAFQNCSGLISVTIPNSVTNIGERAFYGCSGLTAVTIPNRVTSIGNYAFQNCSGLISVTIPNSVTSIGNYAFYLVNTLICEGDIPPAIKEKTFNNLKTIFVPCGKLETYQTADVWSNYSSVMQYKPLPYSVQIQFDTIQGILTNTIKNTICDTVFEMTASSHYGYHFTQWSDGTTDNPRTVTLTQDTAFTAIFAPNKYSIHLSCDSTRGIVSADKQLDYLSEYTFEATPNYGYHFTQWSDGNTDNPRTIIITQDTTFSAEFAPNKYSISVSCNTQEGTIVGNNGQYDYLTEHTCSASPKYGYHFVKWSDGNIDNPRTIVLEKDTSIIAEFAKNPVVTYIYNSSEGYITGETTLPYTATGTVTASVTAKYGYHFTQWSDGVIDNPRTIELTQDTTFEALFAPNIYTLNLQTDNAEMGTVSGEGSFEYQTEVSISATPNYGYHFVQWSGFGKQTQNAITASQAYSIAAALASGEKTSTQYTIVGYVTGKYGTYTNSYYISDSPNVTGKFIAFKCTSSANVGDYVKVTGYLTNYQGTTPETSSGATLTKITQTTYTANPYSFKLTQDTTITAEFAKNTYTLTVQSANTSMGSVTGSGSYEYLSNRSISATAKNGYHFAQWLDGNTDNPRTIELTQDTLFYAQFEKNVYSLEVLANNAEMGTVSGSGSYEYQTQVSVLATANYGYHFAKWSDGVTVNLRSVTITQNMSLTAIFEKNQYTISDNSDQKQGYISGVGSYDYLSKVDLTAVNQYGYHFVQWSDGIKETQRTVELTQDTTFEALFSKNPVITYSCDLTMGKIVGDTTLASEPTGKVTFEAVPNYGYHFVQWSDGDINNPRTIELMQDTAFTAVLAIDRSGKCGVDNQLTWQYDVKAKTLTISGVGSLTSNYTFGVEAPTQMKQLIIGNEVTAIGAKAFYAMTTINHLTIGSGVTSIGDNAFAECKNFDDITCYATDVPVITAKTFANVGNKQYIYLFVPEGRERAYQRDIYWGEFDVQVKNADKVTDPVDDVLVVPTDNTAEITWPAVSEAETYEIAITRDGKVICSLIFNTEGQLTGIAFAPGRNGANYTQKAQTTGFRFTVTGLTSNTHYGFSIVAKDNAEQSLDTKSGTFTTTGVATGMDKVSNDQSSVTSKILHNGQLFILRDGKVYSVTGQEVRCKRYE